MAWRPWWGEARPGQQLVVLSQQRPGLQVSSTENGEGAAA